MQYPQGRQQGSMNVQQLQDTAINVVYFICSVISMPVDQILRPKYGSRYFPVPVVFFSALMMILLPAFSAIATGAVSMIPFVRVPVPLGLFDIGSLSKLYFLLSFIHGVRIWRRMIHPETEEHSQFEGPPLPLFRLLPKGNSFWFCRLVLEPAAVFIASTILTTMFIFTSGLNTYLHIAALCLLMKNFCAWYREWEYLREMLDARNAAPLVGKLVTNQATESELSQIHLAGLPKQISPELRESLVTRIAHKFSLQSQPKEEQL